MNFLNLLKKNLIPWEEEGKHCTGRNQCTQQIAIILIQNSQRRIRAHKAILKKMLNK